MTASNRGFLKTPFKGLLNAAEEYECAFEVRMCPFVKLRAALAASWGGKSLSLANRYPLASLYPAGHGPEPQRHKHLWKDSALVI